jgi:ribonuclease P protein component
VHLHDSGRAEGPRAGFVVSKAVGGAVIRHRVTRRLRHLVAPRLTELPAGALLVVRALPQAAQASSAELAEDLDAGLRGALRKLVGTP